MHSVPEAVDYVLQACEAIAEAHRAGIIHRDLKPKNLFLTTAVHGRPLVKVLDFGISKVDPRQAPGEMQLTKTTEVIGSPSYMSPEQLRSARNVDVRTDIWALGVILYELLTRRLPFYAETVTELVVIVVTETQPPIRNFRPDVPEALEMIINRCLQKQPEHRYQSVVELVQALEPYTQAVHATATERVRAVAGATMPLMAPMPAASSSSNVASIPIPSASSRVNVSGGTSVAWGETQSQVQHVPPRPGGQGTVAAFVGLGLVATLFLTGGAVWYMKRPNTDVVTAPPNVAGENSAVPLPPGRKDLPPIPPPPSATVDPPVPTTLPEIRKPVSTVTKPPGSVKPATGPRPTPTDKPDDLSNIGRR